MGVVISALIKANPITTDQILKNTAFLYYKMFKLNFILGFIILLLGFLIKKYHLSFLIAGYNTTSKEKKNLYDESKLVRVIGDLLIKSSLILFLGGLLSFIFPLFPLQIILFSWIILVIFLVISLIYINLSPSVLKKE